MFSHATIEIVRETYIDSAVRFAFKRIDCEAVFHTSCASCSLPAGRQVPLSYPRMRGTGERISLGMGHCKRLTRLNFGLPFGSI